MADNNWIVRVAKLDEKEFVLKKISEFWDELMEWDASAEENNEVFDKNDYENDQWDGSKITDIKTTLKYPLIAFNNNEMVGYCHLLHDKSDDAKFEWVILDFAIFSKFRRSGFGSGFIHDVINFCKAKSIRNPCKIEASSHIHNRTGLRFWNKNGFETIEKNVSFPNREWIGMYDVNVYTVKPESH